MALHRDDLDGYNDGVLPAFRRGEPALYYAPRGVTVAVRIVGYLPDAKGHIQVRTTSRRAERYGWPRGELWWASPLHLAHRRTHQRRGRG